jgi:hypothetical protein
LTDAASATAFANAIGSLSFASGGSTGTTAAINYSTSQFTNGYEGRRLVIDVSSDGEDNVVCSGAIGETCAPLQAARNNFLSSLGAATGAINALWIADPGNYTAAQLLAYGTTNLVGGTNSFESGVSTSADFGAAMLNKITREFDTPEPTTLPLLGVALAGLVYSRRRKAGLTA